MKLLRSEWASFERVIEEKSTDLQRQFLSLLCLSETTKPVWVDKGILQTASIIQSHWSRCFEWPWCILESCLCKDHRILDAGGGESVFQYYLARYCKEVVNADILFRDDDIIQREKNRIGSFNIRNVLTDLSRRFPFESNSFDSIFCISVLEHIDEYRSVFDEFDRVLKPGGTCLITIDVVLQGRCDDFSIDLPSVRNIFAKYKSELPTPKGRILSQSRGDGLIIACLAMKFEKKEQ